MKLLLSIFFVPVIFSTSVTCDFADDKLKSWINVISFDLIKNKTSGKVIGAVIQTNDKLLKTVEFSLDDRRSTLHSPRVKSSVSLCLHEGHVKYNGKVDISSPVRMKFCKNELSGLFYYYGVVYTLYTREKDRSWIIFTGKDQLKTENGQNKTYSVLAYNETNIHGKPLDKTSDKLRNKLSEPKLLREKRSILMHRRNYIEVMIFISDEFYRDKGSSDEAVIEKAVEVVHYADFYYAAIPEANLHLSLVDVMIWRTPQEDICNDTRYSYTTSDCLGTPS
ncbi:uncharacterized protein LOC142355910, partial [Convolutriloba macropyga]|uniref:uncharacterized protein LOC142355910 n=1 Tax=Convolutriloba macropyga TaxID=536237 RepID=UPI003F51B5A8